MKRITLQLAALLLLASFCYAADTQIKDLTDGSGSVAGTWKVVCDNGTTTYICTANSLLALKIGTVTNAQICAGDSSGKIQCTTDPNTWAAAAHNHSGVYVEVDADLTSLAGGISGVVKGLGNGNGYSAAAYGDVVTLWASGSCSGYLKSDGTCSTPSGGVDVSGTPAQYYWTTWVDADTIKGTSITASKPICSDANGEPAVCAGTEGTWAALGQSNTFTENNTFGNADTDTLTLRSLLVGGNSRAVWIAGSAPTPSYATGTNELYVGGDIESGGNVYAANFISTGTGESYISFGNNSSGRSPTAGAYEMYVDTGVFKLNQNGTEYTVPIATTDYTLSITTTGNTTVTLPTSGTLATLGGEETFSGAKTFSSIITANANLAVGNGSTGPGQVRLMEDSDNGTDYSTITGASDAGSYPSFTFAGSAAGSEDASFTASANMWTWNSSTGAAFTFTPAVTLTGGITSIGAASNLSGGTVTLGALAGAIDAGGATSFEIPNGTGPTVDAAGEIAIDTTSDQLVYYGGAKRVLPYKQYASFVIPAPAATDDINLLKAPYGMTILAINCIVQGTTSVTGQLQECDSAGANCADLDSDITCDADGAADDGSLTDSVIAANGWLRWKTTSVSGTPTFLTVTVTYSVVSD